MKKLLLLLLLSLGFIGSVYASDKLLALTDIDNSEAVAGLTFKYVDCREMIFLPSETLTFANQQMENLLNEIIPEGFEQLDIVLSYVLPEDNESVSNGEDPTFAEVIQVKTISNDCKGASYSLFEETVANEISTLLKAEEALDQANAAIIEQEAKLSSSPEATEDKTIRVLMPHGPFIKEKNAFASTMIDFKHQTIDGQIIETARLTTTLLVFIYDRILNVAFYSNWFPSSDLALHESKVKQWTQDFYNININNPDEELCPPECQALSKAAQKWGRRALDGDTEAQWQMCLANSRAKSEWDSISIYFCKKLAESGDALAQGIVAVAYRDGVLGVSEDLKEAAYWYEKAAEQGNAMAQYSLGRAYFLGEGVLKSLKDSAYWIKKAVENKTDEETSAKAEDAWYKYELWNYE